MSHITNSKEDYLETILMLSGANGTEPVKSIDVATALGYSRASISRAMAQLREDGLVSQERYGQLHLTEQGLLLARSVRRRHDLLKYYLLHILELDPDTAETDACRMEHVISEVTLRKIEECSERHMQEFHSGRNDAASETDGK